MLRSKASLLMETISRHTLGKLPAGAGFFSLFSLANTVNINATGEPLFKPSLHLPGNPQKQQHSKPVSHHVQMHPPPDTFMKCLATSPTVKS